MNINEADYKTFSTRLQEINRIVAAELLPLKENQLNWKPATSSWSVAECIEHLLLAFQGYLTGLDNVITKAKAENNHAVKPFQLTLMGKLMVFAVNPSSKVPIPSPPKFKPKKRKVFNHEVLHQFNNTIQRLHSQLEASRNFDWNKYKITSPVSPLIHLSVGDTYEVLTLHSLRHLKQAQRVIAQPHFPAE